MLPENTVLITGGAGFIGRHLAIALSKENYQVSILDNLSCPNSAFDWPAFKKAHIKCIQGSTLNTTLIQNLVKQNKIIIHFSCVVGVAETIKKPVETISNINGSLNLFKALNSEHILLFGSSADVYGLHSLSYNRPMKEDDQLIYEKTSVNRWIYPKLKAIEEDLFYQNTGSTLVLRFFNTYGPFMDYPFPKRVIPQFIHDLFAGTPLKISGDGQQIRSFCYFKDTIKGILLALKYAGDQNKVVKETFNIGNNQPISIFKLAEFIIQLGMELNVRHTPLPIEKNTRELYLQSFNDTWDRIPDIRKAKQVLGFSPKVKLKEGLKKTLECHLQEFQTSPYH